MESQSVASSSSNSSAVRRRRRRWPAWLLGTFVVLAALAWFAPFIVAHTSLLSWALNAALEEGQGQIAVRQATLGWLKAVELEGLMVHDGNGKPLLEAASIRSSKTLLSLARDWHELGVLTVEQPKVYAHLRADGSNLEDFAAPWLAEDQPPDSQPIALTVDVTGGTVALVDETSGKHWDLSEVSGKLEMSADPAAPLALNAAATLAEGDAARRLALQLKLPSGDRRELLPSEAALTTAGWPLAMLRPLAARFAPGTELAGRLTADLKCQWDLDGQPGKTSLAGAAAVDDLDVAHPLLQSDRLRLKQVQVPCALVLDGRALKVDHLAVACDVGSIEAAGTLRFPAAAGPALLEELASQNYRVAGHLDLARLAKLLPATLRIRPGTELTSGNVALEVESRTDIDGTHRWTGQVNTSDLAAVNAGQRLTWDQPLEIDAAARLDAKGLFVERLACHSDFLQIDGSGTPEKLAATAHYDLAQLARQLEQFVDLAGWQLAGTGEAELQASRDAKGMFEADVRASLQDFQLAQPDEPAWTEPQLALRLQAAGTVAEGGLSRLASGMVQLSAGADRLRGDLTQPVENPAAADLWPVRLHVEGRVARWLQRLRPWMAMEGMTIDGNCQLDALAAFSTTKPQLTELTLSGEHFQFQGAGLVIYEPTVSAACADARLDAATGMLAFKGATFTTATLALASEALTIQLPADSPHEAAPSLRGTIQVQGNLGRLERWLEDPQQPFTYVISGELAGPVELAWIAGRTEAKLNLKGNEVQLLQPVVDGGRVVGLQTLLREPKPGLAATLAFDQSTERLEVTKATLTAQSVNLTASGTIDQVLTRQNLNVQGTIEYDLAQLMPLVEPYVGQGIVLDGHRQGRFAVRGPLVADAAPGQPAAGWAKRLSGQLALGWDAGRVYGLSIGPGELDTKLAAGMLTAAPLDVAVEEGKLTAAPALRLDPEPYELWLPKGPLVSQVRLSPELCDKSLKYIEPLLAQATRADGLISIDLEGARVPLAAPEQSDAAGRLVIHSGQVLPGPLALEIMLLVRQVEAVVKKQVPPLSLDPMQKPLVQLEAQQVPFRVTRGRVTHDAVHMNVGGTEIVTKGSVGFDQTLDLVVEVPLQDKWLGSDPLVAGLKGTTVPVAVGGTFAQPRIDTRSIQQLAAQAARQTVQRKLTEEIDKGLNKLFNPKR